MRKRGDVYRRGGIWWAYIRVGPGQYRRQSTGCRTKEAARLEKARREQQYADPAHHAAHSATLASALERLLDDRRTRGRAAGTLDMYATAARHLLRVLGLEARLVDVTAGAVDRYTAARLAEGASRHTIAKELVTLRGALRGAKRKGEYRADLDEIMPQWSPAYQPRKQWLTPSQVAALLDQLSKRRAAVVAFVVATGARKGEAFRAEWQDVIGTRVHLRGTKTAAANRIVPVVHRECLRFLQIAIAGARAQGPLFDRWRAAHRDLERACRRAGIPRVSWNDLRRTFGSWLKQAGVPLDDIADLLGHTSTTMVRRVYGQDTPQALEQRIRKSLGTTTSQRRSRKSRVRAKKGPKK